MKAQVLFFGNRNDFLSDHCIKMLKAASFETEIYLGKTGENFPGSSRWWEGDYIFAINSPWIIPKSILDRAKKSGLAWNNCTPDMPGQFALNHAIYRGCKNFGITCFSLEETVYSGEVIDFKEFLIYEDDSLSTLRDKCDINILTSFMSVLCRIKSGKLLEKMDNIAWNRNIFGIRSYIELCELKSDMSREEILRRINSVDKEDKKSDVYLNIDGIVFFTQSIS